MKKAGIESSTEKEIHRKAEREGEGEGEMYIKEAGRAI